MNWLRWTLPLVRRERSSKWLFGVCAGLARTTGISVALLRISVVGLGFVFGWKVPVAYAISVVFTRYRDVPAHSVQNDDPLRVEGKDLSDAHERFSVLNNRLAELEAEILSGAEAQRIFDKTLPPERRSAT